MPVDRATVHFERAAERFHPVLFQPGFRAMIPDFACIHGVSSRPDGLRSLETAKAMLYSIFNNPAYPAAPITQVTELLYMSNYPRHRLISC
jgi:hypothetical protein